MGHSHTDRPGAPSRAAGSRLTSDLNSDWPAVRTLSRVIVTVVVIAAVVVVAATYVGERLRTRRRRDLAARVATDPGVRAAGPEGMETSLSIEAVTRSGHVPDGGGSSPFS